MYATKRAPSLAALLDDERILSRLSDQQRPRLVMSIANELETEADTSNFRDVFYRVKEIRDFVAHGTYAQRLDDNNLILWNNYVTGPNVKRIGFKKRDSLPVGRGLLKVRLKEVRWLLQHVHFITGSSDLTQQIYLGEHPVAFAKPPADPSDWDGEIFAT
jgi:hypothetical protein